MDSGIVKVFDALRKAGLERRTLVVFTSDTNVIR
jgi:arylsulfatase A-like enzyme